MTETKNTETKRHTHRRRETGREQGEQKDMKRDRQFEREGEREIEMAKSVVEQYNLGARKGCHNAEQKILRRW